MRKKKSLLFAVSMMLILSGCAKNPESSIIKNKDFDNMLEEANDTENSVDIKQIQTEVGGNYETYQTGLADDKLNINVSVDARVELPDTDNMSVYRVKQKKITNEDLEKLVNALAPGEQLYGGNILEVRTKADIDAEIKVVNDEIEAIDNGTSDMDPENYDVMKAEYQHMLSELQTEYANSPEKMEYEGYETEAVLCNVAQRYAENPNDKYYEWQNELTTPQDEVFYGINDGKDGEYFTIYAQNNEDRGNVLRYAKSTMGYPFCSSVTGAGTDSFMWKEEDNWVKNEYGVDFKETEKESLSISIEEAEKKAEELLSNMNITGFVCCEKDKYCELPDVRKVDIPDREYRQVYKFTYLRQLDNTVVSNEAGSKHIEGWSGDTYVKKDWCGESIEIMVNDSGIVGFYYSSPIEVTETVVESSQLKSFEEIKSIFEEMVIITCGDEDNDVNIDIDKVVLRYTRISEADNYDSGLLVPVWDFIGLKNGGSTYIIPNTPVPIISINAIDGSVIDYALGY